MYIKTHNHKPQPPRSPRHKGKEETDKTKQAQIEQTYEKHQTSSLFPKRGNHNAKRIENHKNPKKKTKKKKKKTRHDIKQIVS